MNESPGRPSPPSLLRRNKTLAKPLPLEQAGGQQPNCTCGTQMFILSMLENSYETKEIIVYSGLDRDKD